jgi:hypothetical protein
MVQLVGMTVDRAGLVISDPCKASCEVVSRVAHCGPLLSLSALVHTRVCSMHHPQRVSKAFARFVELLHRTCGT